MTPTEVWFLDPVVDPVDDEDDCSISVRSSGAIAFDLPPVIVDEIDLRIPDLPSLLWLLRTTTEGCKDDDDDEDDEDGVGVESITADDLRLGAALGAALATALGTVL